jgi:hypothetical protein
MALASQDDVVAALGRELTVSEDVSSLLETASDLVVGYLGSTPDPVPAPVRRVVADMVVAVVTKPAVSTSDYQASGYNVQREVAAVRVGVESATSTGPWLTAAFKFRLRPYRSAKFRGAFSINTAPNATSPTNADMPPYAGDDWWGVE